MANQDDKRKRRYERRQRAQERRLQESRKARRRNLRRNLLMLSGGALVLALVIGGVVLLASTQKNLPPTSFGPAHAETFPPQQINAQPIPRPVQEHVMERGGGHPVGSMLVQYNCVDYQCEPDLVQKLEDLVRGYPPQVYLAPYPVMDAKITLAAPGRLETLDAFDEQRIRSFIQDNLNR